jgi:general secretion pathway protein J
MTGRTSEAGFTLIELMISLALFALVAVAGLALVESTLGIEARTGGRLERLGDMQRAMFVIGADLQQLAPGDLIGDAQALGFTRRSDASPFGRVSLRYAVEDGALMRTPEGQRAQRLLTGVTAGRWRFHAAGTGWTDHWPPAPEATSDWPDAVAIELTVAPDGPGLSGTLRRVVVLPDVP